jgi:hypothetical protein
MLVLVSDVQPYEGWLSPKPPLANFRSKHNRCRLLVESDVMKKGRNDPSHYAKRRMFLFNDCLLFVQVIEDKCVSLVGCCCILCRPLPHFLSLKKLPANCSHWISLVACILRF